MARGARHVRASSSMLPLLLLLLLCWRSLQGERVKCKARNYGFGGTVCVCDENHCDNVEPLRPFSSNEYNVYLSSLSGFRLEYSRGTFLRHENVTNVSGIEVNVDPNTTYQKIHGFGGAFTDAAGINVKSLKGPTREKLVASYFSPEGIEYNFGRVPIGGTDFSVRKYTLDDATDDESLKDFRLSREDVAFKIPLIKEAAKRSKRRIRLIGAAWTAPPWMKSNDDYVCFGVLRQKFYDLWAQYHIRFLEEYQKRGLRFWGVSTGNEPTAGLLPYYSFNCMGWTPLTQSRWVSQSLAPRLRKTAFNETFIIGIDDQRFTLPWWPLLLFKNRETETHVAGIGLHWYWDDYFPPNLLDWTHRLFPNKFILSTEACFVREGSSPAVHLGSWKRGEKYAENIITNLNHYVGGWIDWNLALDLEGGPNWANNVADAPIIVNASAGEFYKQPMYYALGHFSKFIPENSVRIGIHQTASSGFATCAFLTPDNNIVVVLLNKSEKVLQVNIRRHAEATATVHMPEKSMATSKTQSRRRTYCNARLNEHRNG